VLIANYEFSNGEIGDITSATTNFNFLDIGPIANIRQTTGQENGQNNRASLYFEIMPNGHLVEDTLISILDKQTGNLVAEIPQVNYSGVQNFNNLIENYAYYAVLSGSVHGVNQTLASTIGQLPSSTILPGPVIGNIALDVRNATTSDVYVELFGDPTFLSYVASAKLVSQPQSIFNLFNFNTVTTQLSTAQLASIKAGIPITVETTGLQAATDYVTTLEITGNTLDIDSNNQVAITTLPEQDEILQPDIYSVMYYQTTPGVAEVTVD